MVVIQHKCGSRKITLIEENGEEKLRCRECGLEEYVRVFDDFKLVEPRVDCA